MSRPASRNEVEVFRRWISGRMGLRFDDDRMSWLGEVLSRRAKEAQQQSVLAYLAHLDRPEGAQEWDALGRDLTVCETSFFRNIEHFHVLRDVVVPARIAARPQHHHLRILSAGCATGEEPYSIAMTLADMGPLPGKQVTVHALDLNRSALDFARHAHYSGWSLRDTPAAVRRRWFSAAGHAHVLHDQIKTMVRFEQRNLAQDDPHFWHAERFDAIFCRNVLMYFTAEQTKSVLERMIGALAPGGYLFLGYAESLRGLSDDCHLRHTHETFYYQRKEIGEAKQTEPAPHAGPMQPVDFPTKQPRELVQAPSLVSAASRYADVWQGRGTHPGMPAGIAHAYDLFAQEFYLEAEQALKALTPALARDASARRLHAMLLVHGGHFDEAEQVCRELLRADELDADAHHVLALCREAEGDVRGALDSEQTATYLDPVFAMAHLHLGIIARRQGRPDLGCRELQLALRLISREDDARVKLFGGGFSRHALSSLCQAELQACGRT